MKKFFISAAIATAALVIAAQNIDNDPVLMTIDGRDVYLSEFEYLYNKNNTQQLVPLSFDDYVDMFVNYKLKVADALNAKIDTTSAYKAEINKFRRDLAQPYLNDSTVIERLVQEAYSHTGEDVYVSHIMLSGQDTDGVQKLDSIRELILNGVITFEDAALQNSIDRNSSVRGGRMGWVTGAGLYPWPFEKAAFDTPVGQISGVINSGIGYHLVRPEMRRPAAGQVLAQHILLFTRGKNEEEVAKVKEKIDSIYKVVTTPGVNFAHVAKAESQDRGSAEKGGELGWFGPGQMVAEFDSVAFAMPVGAISEPFKTAFGYHIIHKLEQRPNGTLEEMRPMIEKAMANDSRRDEPVRSKIRATAQRLNASINLDYKKHVADALAASNGKGDAECLKKLRNDNMVVFSACGKDYTLSEIIAEAPLREDSEAFEVTRLVDNAVQRAFDNAITDFEISEFYVTIPAYRNLYNEYRDGILLFDISQEKVWDKAAKDTKALENYFKQNKKKYCDWKAPRYKAYVIFTANDSINDLVKNYVNKKYGKKPITKIDQDTFIQDVKDQFGGQVKIQRVIAAQGENEITDYLGFNGPKPDNKSRSFKSYFAFAGKVINQPEEYLDAKGAVVTDYQNYLEKIWLDDLRKRYPVVINRDVLDQAR